MLAFRSPTRFIPVALAVSLVSCHDTTPSGPNGFLTGSWGRSSPAGFSQVNLQSAGGIVTGTFVDVCCGTGGIETDGTVSGTYGGGGFTLTFAIPAKDSFWMGTNATWTGHLTDINNWDWLEGPLTENAPATSTLFSSWSMARLASP